MEMTLPEPSVLRSVEVMPEMAKLVVVALVVVEVPVMVSPPTIVDDAVVRNPVDCHRVEVALVQVTKSASLVKSIKVMSVKSRESSSMVVLAICSPSIWSLPSSHCTAPSVRLFPVVMVRPAEVMTPDVVSFPSFLKKLSGIRLSPMVVDAMTLPSLLVERMELVMFSIAKLVVVAFVVVAFPVIVKFPAIVLDAAFAMKPASKSRSVEVALPRVSGVQANGTPTELESAHCSPVPVVCST